MSAEKKEFNYQPIFDGEVTLNRVYTRDKISVPPTLAPVLEYYAKWVFRYVPVQGWFHLGGYGRIGMGWREVGANVQKH
jgi:hypothetical protein